MSLTHSPNIVTSNLAFNYDAANPQCRFRTNLITTAEQLSAYTPNQSVTVSQQGSYFKVVANQTNSTPGVYPIGGSIPVTGSTRYTFRAYGYVESGSNASMYIYSNVGGQLLYSTTLPTSPGWIEATVTTNASDTSMQVGFLWSGPLLNSAIRLSKVGLYKTDAPGDLVGGTLGVGSNLTHNTGYTTFNGTSSIATWAADAQFNTQTPSVEVWIRPNGLSQSGFFFEKGTVNSQYALFFEGANTQWRTYNTGTSTYNDLSTTTASYMTSGVWNHVVATATSGSKILYVNGVQVNSNTATVSIPTSTGSGASIGAYGGYTGSHAYYYNGDIAVVRVYTSVLTAAQVKQNFDAMKRKFGL